MENKELNALFARIEESISRVNAGEITLESVATEFGLIKTKYGYVHSRWGWSVEFNEKLGYSLYY